MKAITAKIRRALHRCDPIECWCELTPADAKGLDTRPVAETNCWDCGVLAGQRHEWSCREVPADLFIAFLSSKRS
ncbi:hypothetical protein AB0B94_30410 [Micromonospora sp. NPDC048986]|uniref:hypothetical protein n=1 Tax=Micromonospora sp. NPDC048986 TaxID=3155644 RepID=UPI0033C7EB0F